MRRLPPLRAVVALEATVRAGGMAPAAAELGITPSAVSHRIAGLEQHLGRALFRRLAGRVEPTPYARDLAHRYAAALDEIADASTEGADPARTVGVHVAVSLAAKWLRPRLAGFLAAHPGTELRIVDGGGVPDFDAGLQVGLVLRTDAPPDAAVLLPETLRPLCSPALRKRLPKRAAPADVLALPLLHSRNPVGWGDWCRGLGLPRPVGLGLRFDRSHMAIAAACEGLGVVLESDLLTEAERRERRLVPVLAEAEAVLPGPGYVLMLAPGRPTRAVQGFVAWLRAEAGALAKPAPRRHPARRNQDPLRA